MIDDAEDDRQCAAVIYRYSYLFQIGSLSTNETSLFSFDRSHFDSCFLVALPKIRILLSAHKYNDTRQFN
jgi:hypothetical protein